MTNYNERLEQQLFRALTKGGIEKEKEIESKGRYIHRPMKSIVHEEIEALTSLVKELVAEARIEALDHIIDLQSKQFNRWTQKDIADFFNGIGKYYRELKAQQEEV